MQLKFTALVRQPHALDKPAAVFLGQMLEEYPYCQPARMLYAKSIKNTDNQLFKKHYDRALLCAPDRRIFNEFISKNPHETDNINSSKNISTQEVVEDEIVNKPAHSKVEEVLIDTAGERIVENTITYEQQETDKTEVFAGEDDAEADNREEKIHYQQRIIDRFLEKDPRIEISKEGGTGGELSRTSIEDNPDLASETLAEILLKQGKKERAILIYKKLMLLFPEKSSYFAKKLERIESDNN